MRPREVVQLVGVLAGVGVVAYSLVTWSAWIALVIIAGLMGAGLWQWAKARQRHPEVSDLLLGFLLLAVLGFLALTESPANPARTCEQARAQR